MAIPSKQAIAWRKCASGLVKVKSMYYTVSTLKTPFVISVYVSLVLIVVRFVLSSFVSGWVSQHIVTMCFMRAKQNISFFVALQKKYYL